MANCISLEKNLRTRKDYKDYLEAKELLRIVGENYPLTNAASIMDLCCGSGMLGFYFLECYPNSFVYFVDIKKSNRFTELEKAAATKNYVFIRQDIYHLQETPGSLLLAIHACNTLTDRIIQLGIEKQKPFAVMTCCHRREMAEQYQDVLPIYFLPAMGLGEYIDIGRVRKINQAGRAERTGRKSMLVSADRKATKKNNVIMSWKEI